MINKILPYAFDSYFFLVVLGLAQGVLYHEFVERTVFSSILEDGLLLQRQPAHDVVELHQYAAMGNCEYFDLGLGFQLFLLENMSFDQSRQKR